MNETNFLLDLQYLIEGNDVVISIFTIMAMSFINAAFVLFLVYERSMKSIHLQSLIGLNPFLYWVANFTWDMVSHLVSVGSAIGVFKFFNFHAYVSGENFFAVVSLLVLYGWSMTPLMYPLSFLFKNPSNAFIILNVMNSFTGAVCIETTFFLQVI